MPHKYNTSIDKTNHKRFGEARHLAEHICATIPLVSGVCIGGSLVHPDQIRKLDDTSDIDLFCYLNSDTLPSALELEQLLIEKGGILDPCTKSDVFADTEYEVIRNRQNLLEFRRMLGGFDTNVKFFSVRFMRFYVNAPASMDEHFLEEIDSYQRMKVLASNNDNVINALNHAHARKSQDIPALALLALERYGKTIANAVGQGLRRGNQPATVALNLMQAVNWIICIFYLQNNEYPGTLKWRASERFLSVFERGVQLHALIEEWEGWPTGCSFRKMMASIRAMEDLVADSWTLYPWSLCSERWWWQNQSPFCADVSRTRHIKSHNNECTSE